MKRDKVFADKKSKVEPFEFNKEVTSVFSDMLNRSVPLYGESIKRQAQLAYHFYQSGTHIYDLGCSHGNLGIQILSLFNQTPFSMIAVDSSEPMIEKYSNRLEPYENSSQVELICSRLEDIKLENASVVLINLTLQFVDIQKRDDLIRKIYRGLTPNGILLLTEKTIHKTKQINDIQTHYYKTFKLENGYSELEISQKRDALEKVLVPDTVETHKNRMSAAGFDQFDIWMKWFNFVSMIAIKK